MGKFSKSFSKPVNLSLINIPVLSQWIEERIATILGFDDEIVSSTAINLFLPTAAAPSSHNPSHPPSDSTGGGGVGGENNVNPRRAQLDLAGFLGEKEAADFASELWDLMLSAQSHSMGIPPKLLEK